MAVSKAERKFQFGTTLRDPNDGDTIVVLARRNDGWSIILTIAEGENSMRSPDRKLGSIVHRPAHFIDTYFTEVLTP